MSYKHILVAVDLSEDSERLVAKADSLAQAVGAKLSLVHIDVNYAELYTGLIREVHTIDETLRKLADHVIGRSSRLATDHC